MGKPKMYAIKTAIKLCNNGQFLRLAGISGCAVSAFQHPSPEIKHCFALYVLQFNFQNQQL
jgi:hypothetical protein